MDHAISVLQKKIGISGGALKIIALLSMLLDHIGAAVIYPVFLQNLNPCEPISPQIEVWVKVYPILRGVGRIAFPIFCFLLVEGFLHSKNIKKYAARLFLFAIISEIPFDLAFSQSLTFRHQNVFFTLFLGLLSLVLIEKAEEYVLKKETEGKQSWIPFSLMRWGFIVGVMFIGMIVATLLKTDYSGIGVLLIIGLYLLRENKMMQVLVGAITLSETPMALVGFLCTLLYNGKRGINLKYVFYLFYPVHLLILYYIATILFKIPMGV